MQKCRTGSDFKIAAEAVSREVPSMFFAMCPDGGIIIFALLFLVLAGCVCVAAVLAAAVYATIGLAKLAAARHNRLAANAKYSRRRP